MSLYLALIHYPVVDRNGHIITSSVTNLDLHDIARACKTFGVTKYFVVHPSPDEQALNRRIIHHWEGGYGKSAHPTRSDALEVVQLASDFGEVLAAIETEENAKPLCVGTSAKKLEAGTLSLEELRGHISQTPVLLVFGTGYGLAPDWMSRLDGFLGPILGPASYNHLSVRSAVSIYLDRLLGAASR